MTQFEKIQEILREMGLPFSLTDDSEEYPMEDFDSFADIPDTAVVIKDVEDADDHDIIFLFRKDGSFKELVVL